MVTDHAFALPLSQIAQLSVTANSNTYAEVGDAGDRFKSQGHSRTQLSVKAV